MNSETTMVPYCKDLNSFLHAVNLMIVFRTNAGWTENIGSGFVAEDINDIYPLSDGSACTIRFSDRFWTASLDDMNLRELKELKKRIVSSVASKAS